MVFTTILVCALMMQTPLKANELAVRLQSPVLDEDAEQLARGIRARLTDDPDLENGAWFIDDAAVAFVIQIPNQTTATPVVTGYLLRQQSREMKPIGQTGLWAFVLEVPEDAKGGFEFQLGDETLGRGSIEMPGWTTPPEAVKRDGVSYGQYLPFNFRSEVFGNDRTGSIYLPASYDPALSAALMVFQDGDAYRREHAGTVVENLIADGLMPVTILVLLNPGVNDDGSRNRSVEYDTLSDRYATFLDEEVIPRVAQDYKLHTDPAFRGICGASSGGICAFTVAWERPDLFGRVCSHIGSYTNIRGGGAYPKIVSNSPQKPITKIVLHDGTNDIINRFGDWWLANNQMFKALRDKGYDVEFITDASYHSYSSAGRVLPETLAKTWEGWRELDPQQ